jgi:hypothetical protein
MNRKQRRDYVKKMNTPQKLEIFSAELEKKLRAEYDEKYKKFYQKNLNESIDNFILTIVYTLHFHEKTKFGNARIKEFMSDLLETVDMFRREEANPEDYRKQLKEDGIIVKGVEEKDD